MLVNQSYSVHQTTQIDTLGFIKDLMSYWQYGIAPSKDDYVAQHLTECKMVCTNI